jgi:hypothetical protein
MGKCNQDFQTVLSQSISVGNTHFNFLKKNSAYSTLQASLGFRKFWVSFWSVGQVLTGKSRQEKE